MNRPHQNSYSDNLERITIPISPSLADPMHLIRYITLPGGWMYGGGKLSRFLIKLLIWAVKRDIRRGEYGHNRDHEKERERYGRS